MSPDEKQKTQDSLSFWRRRCTYLKAQKILTPTERSELAKLQEQIAYAEKALGEGN